MIKNEKVKALPFMVQVAQFAQAKGLRFFTWKEQKNAIELYLTVASVQN